MAQEAQQRTLDELWARTLPRRATAYRANVDLTREQVIEQIRSLNPSATIAFLELFEALALRTYLEHLLAAQEPRGRQARWERPGDSPAIMGWVSAN